MFIQTVLYFIKSADRKLLFFSFGTIGKSRSFRYMSHSWEGVAFCFYELYLTMRQSLLIIVLVYIGLSCSGQTINQRQLNELVECRDTWQYFKLDHQIRGKVLSYAKGLCGYFTMNSATIIVTSAHDTIRVLELPCYHGLIVKSDSVLVKPVSKPDSAGAILDVNFTCLVKRTCYGHVTKVQ